MFRPSVLALVPLLAAAAPAPIQQPPTPPTVAATLPAPAALPTPAPVAAPDRLTLAQALALAAQQSPQERQARETVHGARETAAGNALPLPPTVGYAPLGNGFAPFVPRSLSYGSNYNATVTVETSGRQGARTRQGRSQLRQAQADLGTADLTAGRGAAESYISLQVAGAQYDAETQAYAIAARLSDLTQKQYQLGAVPETAALRTNIALIQEAQNVAAAVNAVETARAALNLSLGRDAEAPVDVAEPIPVPAGGAGDAGNAGAGTETPLLAQREYLALAYRNRPEIRSATAATGTAAATVALERANYYPDLVLGRNLQTSEATGSAIQVGFIVPLDLGSIRHAVNRARSDQKVTEENARGVRLQVASDVQTAYANAVLGRRQVETFRTSLLPAAQILLSKIERGYKAGGSTILDLIDAQSTLRLTRVQYIAALGSERTAEIELRRATGAPAGTANTGAGAAHTSAAPAGTPAAPKGTNP